MSIHAIKWAWSQDCPNPTAKLVLVALADHANADGECWPTMKTVAELAGVSRRTVHDHVKALEEHGLLRRGERRMHRGQFRGWTFHLPVASGSTPPLPVAADCRSGTVSGTTSEPPVFETDFWEQYPKRNGKRVGRKQAVAQWKRLSDEDRRAVVAALPNYAAAADDPSVFCPVKDPWRWLRDRLFDDWQEPAVPDNAPPHMQPCPECGETLGWTGHPQCGVRVEHG